MDDSDVVEANRRNIIDNFGMDWFLDYGIWVLVTAAAAVVLWWALHHWMPRWIDWLVSRATPQKADWSRASDIISRLILWIGSIVLIVISVVVILPLVGVAIDDFRSELSNIGHSLIRWLRSSGIRVAVIIGIAIAVQQIVRGLIPTLVTESVVRKEKRKRFIEEAEQRAETLSNFLVGVAVALVWVVAVFMVLPEFRINIGPLLAGAGIMGIAIGFGAQNLIRDLLGGLFVILEDQYAKGDWVALAGIDGEVESIGLRRTILRDFDGTHHTIPNGEVRVASNFSKDWACVNMDMSVGYGEDLDRVAEIINRVSLEMAQEDGWRDMIIEPAQVLRVQNFGDSGIDLKIWGKTKPMMQWGVTGELKRRLKMAFDEEGVEIPWPHVKLYFGDTPQSSDVQSSSRARRHRPPPDVKGSGE